MFIVKRIDKYKSRGFKIDLCFKDFMRDFAEENNSDDEIGVIKSPLESNKISDPEKWAMAHILNILYNELQSFVYPLFVQAKMPLYKIYFLVGLQETLAQRLGDELMNKLVRHIYYTEIVQMPLSYAQKYESVFQIENPAPEPEPNLNIVDVLAHILTPHVETSDLNHAKERYINNLQPHEPRVPLTR
jgi:hypothetical protein